MSNEKPLTADVEVVNPGLPGRHGLMQDARDEFIVRIQFIPPYSARHHKWPKYLL